MHPFRDRVAVLGFPDSLERYSVWLQPEAMQTDIRGNKPHQKQEIV